MATYVLQPIGAGPAITTFDPQIRFIGSATPVPAGTWNVNDIWIDTTSTMVLKRWNGTAFVT